MRSVAYGLRFYHVGGGALEKKEMLVTRAKMFSINYLTPTYCGDNNVNEMFNV